MTSRNDSSDETDATKAKVALKTKRQAMVLMARADVEKYWRSPPGSRGNAKLHRAMRVLMMSQDDWAPPQHT